MKILIVDDTKAVRERVAAMVNEMPGMEVVGQAASAAEGASLSGSLEPDVVILDIRMPGGYGIDLLTQLKRARPDLFVIMLTNYPYRQYRTRLPRLL